MISSHFALSKLRKKKLVEVIKNSEYFLGYKYVKVRKMKVFLAKNIFQFIFRPVISDLDITMSLLNMDNTNSKTIGEKIDTMFASILAKKYDLSPEKKELSMREIFRRGALKEPLYIEKYINTIYGFVKDKYSAQMLSIIEILDSAKNVVKPSIDRVEVVIKNAILRELSLLRSPPNRISLGILRVA